MFLNSIIWRYAISFVFCFFTWLIITKRIENSFKYLNLKCFPTKFVQKCIHALADRLTVTHEDMKRFWGAAESSFLRCIPSQIKGCRWAQERLGDDRKKHKDTHPQKPHKCSPSLKQPHTLVQHSHTLIQTFDWSRTKVNAASLSLSFSLILPPLLSKACGPLEHLSLSACSCVGWPLMWCLVDSSPRLLHLSHSLLLHAHKVTVKSQVKESKNTFSFTAKT